MWIFPKSISKGLFNTGLFYVFQFVPDVFVYYIHSTRSYIQRATKIYLSASQEEILCWL